MNISPINSTQPAFNGYVDKSVKSLVKDSVNEICNSKLRMANNNAKPLLKTDVNDYIEQGRRILSKFTEYTSQLHPKTALKIDTYTSFYQFYFTNKKLNTAVVEMYTVGEGVDTQLFKDNVFINSSSCFETAHSDPYHRLNVMETVADELLGKNGKGIDPQQLDAALFNQKFEKMKYTARHTAGSWLNKIKHAINKHSVNTLAKEMGAEKTDFRAKLIEESEKNIAENKMTEQNKKQLNKYMDEFYEECK